MARWTIRQRRPQPRPWPRGAGGLRAAIVGALGLCPPLLAAAKRLRYAALRCVGKHEDYFLAKLARRRSNVFFVQIGAHDGVTDDFLRRFIVRYRWQGILVEPVRELFDRLVANYRGVDGLAFINKAITVKDGRFTFYRVRGNPGALPKWHDQLGSLERATVLSHKDSIPDIEDYMIEEVVEGISFKSLSEAAAIDKIDMILVDAEGADFDILSQIDFDRYHPDLIIYEHSHLPADQRAEAVSLLQRRGYKIRPVGGNSVAYAPRLA